MGSSWRRLTRVLKKIDQPDPPSQPSAAPIRFQGGDGLVHWLFPLRNDGPDRQEQIDPVCEGCAMGIELVSMIEIGREEPLPFGEESRPGALRVNDADPRVAAAAKNFDLLPVHRADWA